MTNYIPTIGIEVHVELKTNTKIFSDSKNGYGQMANSYTNVIDLGYPGTLPTLNMEVVNLAIKVIYTISTLVTLTVSVIHLIPFIVKNAEKLGLSKGKIS